MIPLVLLHLNTGAHPAEEQSMGRHRSSCMDIVAAVPRASRYLAQAQLFCRFKPVRGIQSLMGAGGARATSHGQSRNVLGRRTRPALNPDSAKLLPARGQAADATAWHWWYCS
jgi:hypothetical protein